jgi:translation initiation factor 1
MKKRERVDVSGSGSSLDNNPFASLSTDAFGGAVAASKPRQPVTPAKEQTRKEGSRGRVDVIRQKAGRGGKTVTVLSGFKGIGMPELEQIARDLRKACGVGGTLKGSTIEIQGDQCDRALEHLVAAGFRPVRAGG